MVTIKEVAKHAGVAVSTVSNVLNNPEIVSSQTQEKVLLAVKALGYTPNIHGQSLRQAKQNKIGVFLNYITGEFYLELLQSASTTAAMREFSVNIFFPAVKERANIINTILNGMNDGAIILDAEISDSDMEKLAASGFPVVFVDREIVRPNISSVLIDNKHGSYQLTKYLIKTGHRSISFIHGRHNYDNQMRYKGYLDALSEHNLKPYTAFECVGYYSQSNAYNAITACCNKGIRLPDAFFAANDEMAFGVIQALDLFGYKVPSNVSVVGFDDDMLSEFFFPPLTTVQSPRSAMGRVAAETLISMINGEIEGKRHFLSTKVVIRSSADIRVL